MLFDSARLGRPKRFSEAVERPWEEPSRACRCTPAAGKARRSVRPAPSAPGWPRTRLAVAYWDERFTTAEAESALWPGGLTHKQRRPRRDRVAAQILLLAYLETGCPTHEGRAPEQQKPRPVINPGQTFDREAIG